MPQFRAKARAVDLLGKGQIADLPTAISELWKNGYDAYGDSLEGFLYMPGYKGFDAPIFALSDDGKGMNDDDILEKWFVLGTDSKTRGNIDKRGEDTLWKEPRVKMGEKGIGRLAVAYLGPQMLMLTKKLNSPLQLVFFDWRILENYDLFLTDVNIPLRAITSISDFENAFLELKKEFLQNFPELKPGQKDPWKDQKDLKDAIVQDCKELKFPTFLSEELIEDLVFDSTKSHATRFIIFKPDQQLIDLRNFTKNDENEEYKDDVSVNYTVSTLVGLFNLFKTENPVHKTHFWIYEKGETGRYDLLTHKSFFTPTDFDECDHLIDGEFDSEGEFNGKVRIYGKTVSHKYQPIRKKGKTNYGPFAIRLGYVQHDEDESISKGERKRAFEEKLALYSGLFIYRDGFRVLPYGRPDTDFLEFEERRSRHAGFYFFSKRRMFGYIDISREANERLKDKSSREGFLNNQAFRDFKVDLIGFFVDLAKKYFATKAEFTYKDEQQEELKEKAEAANIEHEKDIAARREFAKNLTRLPKELASLTQEYDNYTAQLESKANQSNLVYEEIQDLVSRIEQCKVKIAEYRLTRPARFKPTDLQTQKYHAYNKQYKKTLEHFDNAADLLNKVRDKLKVHELFREFENKAELYKNTLISHFKQHESELNNIFNKIGQEFDSERNIFLGEFEEKYGAIIPKKDDAKEIGRSMKLLEKIFRDSQERMLKKIQPFFEHLRRLSFEVNEDNLVGYYKDRFEEMKEEWNKTYELAQLGIAVEIIDHQFNTLYSQLAESIKTFHKYLQPGREAENKYKNLSTAFEHLQDNYKLLQPLYRTTGKVRSNLTAQELKEYVEEFFKTRFEDNNIKFTITDRAKAWTAFSYESIFKPVLINIINNAIFWLHPAENKEIRLDAIGERLLILNSGVPIEDYMLDDIFKLFYSNRPKGRGIGLYLAKQSLEGIGFNIFATNDKDLNTLNGACFVIEPISKS